MKLTKQKMIKEMESYRNMTVKQLNRRADHIAVLDIDVNQKGLLIEAITSVLNRDKLRIIAQVETGDTSEYDDE